MLLILAAAAADGGGAVFDPASLFAGTSGDYWEIGDLATVFVDAAGTDPVDTNGDPIGCWKGKRGEYDLTQADTGSKFIYRAADNCAAVFDGKNMLCEVFDAKSGDVPFSWYVFSRMSTTDDNYGQEAQILLAESPVWYAVHKLTVFDTGSNTSRAAAGNYNASTSYADKTARPARNQWGSLVSVVMGTTGGANKFYYDDDETNQRATGTCTPYASTDSGVMYVSAYPSSGEWQVKMILGIARELTTEEVASLHAYAGALP